MLSYAGVPLLYELDDSLAVFLERFMSLEGGRIFADSIPAQRELRHGTQGHQSHLMGLPTFNWPPEPPPRLNTLRWPSGATRWATFFALVTDSELDRIRATVCDDATGKVKPAQLVIADASYDGPVVGHEWSNDPSGLTLLSTEMWMLTPKRISGSVYDPTSLERLWVVPLVDVRYFWQFVATDGAFYSDVKVIKVSDTKWRVEFVGKWARQDVPTLSIDGANLTPAIAAFDAPVYRAGSAKEKSNEIQEIYLTPTPTCGTFTLTFDGETTSPVPFDATAEEIADALSALSAFQVTWETLAKNCELSLDVFDQDAESIFEYGEFSDRDWFPDRTEFRRRHENVALVMDAIAASTGRRIVRDVRGITSIMPAYDTSTVNASDNLESNVSLTGPEKWSLIAGGIHRATTANSGNLLWNGLGSDIPEAIDVVFRDLSREGRSGELDSGVAWESQSGLLTVTVPVSVATNDDSSDLKPFFPDVVAGLRHTIHTPSLNNQGTIVVGADGSGDDYSRLATRLAAKYYDWLWAAFDLTYASVKQWEPTGFDDAWEIEAGRWRLGLEIDDDRRGFVTRITSLPRNAMPGQQLVQCGSQCLWTEDMIQGEVREALDPALHPRLSASRVRAWAWLPAMELQGETAGLLSTHKRAVTITLRSADASADAGTYFQAVKFFCENSVNWLDCSRYCGTADWIWNASPSLPGAWAQDSECIAACESVPPTADGSTDGQIATTNCIDDGSMTLD